MSKTSSNAETDENGSDNETYQKVAGLTCVSIFSCCSLVESVVEDLVQRLAQFFEEAEVEFKQQRQMLVEAFEKSDVERMINVMEERSPRYAAAVQRLLAEGRTAATRSYRKLHTSIDINRLMSELKHLDEDFIPPIYYRQKRRSTLASASRGNASAPWTYQTSSNDLGTALTPFNDGLKRLTDLKMTPKLASAMSRFHGDLLRREYQGKSVLDESLAEHVEEEEEDGGEDEVFSPSSPAEDCMTLGESEQMQSLPAVQDEDHPMGQDTVPNTTCRTDRMSLAPDSAVAHLSNTSLRVNGALLSQADISRSAQCTPYNAELMSARYNCETIMEESNQPNLLSDPGSNLLMSMFKSPILRIQEKLGLGSHNKKSNLPTPAKTPVRQIKTFHRRLRPLPPKKSCVRPDQDELMIYAETRTSQLAPWGATSQYHSTVIQQQEWNPYSIFGLGVRVIAYEDVFQTPDFRALARAAASELRTGLTGNRAIPGRESRIERWYKDSNGYNTGEGMNSKQLEFMVTALKKKVDISHLAYQDTWEPCDENCTHHSTQPWVKQE